MPRVVKAKGGVKKSKEMKALAPLTLQQQSFVLELLCDPNFDHIAAARKVGFLSPEKNATTLLRHPLIATAIRRFQNARVERSKTTSDRILQEVEFIALMDVVDLFSPDGKLMVDNVHTLPERIRRCIRELKVRELRDREGNIIGVITEVKLWDKNKALELSMRHRGMLNDKIRVEGRVELDWDKLLGDDAPVRQHDPNVIDVSPDNMRDLVLREENNDHAPIPTKYSLHKAHDPQAEGDATYGLNDLLGDD